MLGWEGRELLGGNLLELVHPDDRAATKSAVAALGLAPDPVSFENRLRHRDGTYRWIMWTAVPSEGVVSAVGRDVTERERHSISACSRRRRWRRSASSPAASPTISTIC